MQSPMKSLQPWRAGRQEHGRVISQSYDDWGDRTADPRPMESMPPPRPARKERPLTAAAAARRRATDYAPRDVLLSKPMMTRSPSQDAIDSLRLLKRQAPAAAAPASPPRKRVKAAAPPPPRWTQLLQRQRAAGAPLVERCASFTRELKSMYPPGSAEFGLYVTLVHTKFDDRDTVLQLVALLRPRKDLLDLFLSLLPKWCFYSAT
ncbi:hypothetical protein M885DRAFT_510002 [Pelagophyceae sp. CCMP2097]|nr:hypothetical protein M885DRAFT_510002 [Pelagophyceae sp. CCMP2097]